MQSLEDNITKALADHRDTRTAYERFVFDVDLSDPEQVKYLETLEARVKVTESILDRYINQVPRTA